MKTEPDWIEHDGSAVCPVPAGHDCEVARKDGFRMRSDCPTQWRWGWCNLTTDIDAYRDWTAFEQQQASAEVPERPFTKLRRDVFDVLRRHDVSEQCFAEIAAITHSAVAAHEQPPFDPLAEELRKAYAEAYRTLPTQSDPTFVAFVAACRARGVTVAKGAGTIQHLGSHTPQPFSDD